MHSLFTTTSRTAHAVPQQKFCTKNSQAGGTFSGRRRSKTMADPIRQPTEGHAAILRYFHFGYEYKHILCLLKKFHDVHLSLQQLKRFLNARGLKRKGGFTPDEVVRTTIQNIIDGGQIYMGYRTMWHHLKRKYHLHVRRDTVMKVLKEIDPEGALQRRTRRLKRRVYRSVGPNYTWHLDGYDKLKPYGFAVHGCIDGFSRKLIWLNAASSNNNPSVIARYYLESIKYAKGVPAVLRCDRGTENQTIRAMQCFLRQSHDDSLAGARSFVYGSSVSNQRIEAFWSLMRRTRLERWITSFKDLVDDGFFTRGDRIQSDMLRFCCMDVLQEELQDVVTEWNHHRIRFSRMAECPSGIPSLLYSLPEECGGEESLKAVSEDDMRILEDDCSWPCMTQDPDIFDFLTYVMDECEFAKPSTIQEGIALYLKLRDVVVA